MVLKPRKLNLAIKKEYLYLRLKLYVIIYFFDHFKFMFLLIFKKSWLISKLESDKIKIESDSLQVNAGINIFD